MRQIDPYVRAIVLSGYDEDDLKDRFLGDPPAGFLPKPFSAGEVIAKICDVLQQ